MNQSIEQNKPVFNTEHPLAAFMGFLVIPAIATILTFIGSIILVSFVNPSELEGFDLMIYIMDFIFIPYLLIVFYVWIKRKKVLPVLMIIYFLIQAIWNITYFAKGYGMDFFNLFMSIVWIVYFIRSERVKQTFIY